MDDRLILQNRLREARSKRGLSQAQLVDFNPVLNRVVEQRSAYAELTAYYYSDEQHGDIETDSRGELPENLLLVEGFRKMPFTMMQNRDLPANHMNLPPRYGPRELLIIFIISSLRVRRRFLPLIVIENRVTADGQKAAPPGTDQAV